MASIIQDPANDDMTFETIIGTADNDTLPSTACRSRPVLQWTRSPEPLRRRRGTEQLQTDSVSMRVTPRWDSNVNNTLYIAADGLRLNGKDIDAPGAGLFRQIEDRLILTDPDAGSLTRWRLPPAFCPDAGKPLLSYHRENDSAWCPSLLGGRPIWENPGKRCR